jgi:hypothetical protein
VRLAELKEDSILKADLQREAELQKATSGKIPEIQIES